MWKISECNIDDNVLQNSGKLYVTFHRVILAHDDLAVLKDNILLMKVGGTINAIMKTCFCFAFIFSCFSCLFNSEVSRLSQTQVG